MMAADLIGRRHIVLLTSWEMCACLVAAAVAFSFIPVNASTLELENESVSPAAIVVLVFIIWFVFFYSVLMGNTAWMNTDMFPMEVRSVGTNSYPAPAGRRISLSRARFEYDEGDYAEWRVWVLCGYL
jgi:SP family myo-inositol transporter-like MFS transporter 13